MDLDSNFSVFGVQRFSEWPGPLYRIAFPVEILTKPLDSLNASHLFTETPFFFTEKCFVATTSQESAPKKRGSRKGRFCGVQGHAQGNKKYPPGIGRSSTFGAHSVTAKRGVHFFKNPLLKTPLSWFLINVLSSLS